MTYVIPYVLYVLFGNFVTRRYLIDKTGTPMPVFLFLVSVLFAWPFLWLLIAVMFSTLGSVKPREKK